MSYGIDVVHNNAIKKIEAQEPGWAFSSNIKGQPASYNRWSGWYGTGITMGPGNYDLRDQYDEMLLDVARDEGIASKETFSRSYVERRIEGLRMYGSWNKKEHKQADCLESFYLNGPGKEYLYD